MNVVIRTPEAEVYSGQADSVSLATELGAIQIFPGHASLQGVIVFSPLRLDMGERRDDYVIQRGFVMVDQEKDEVSIMVYRCEKRAEMELVTAKQYLDYILKILERREGVGRYQLEYLEEEKTATEKRLELLNEPE